MKNIKLIGMKYILKISKLIMFIEIAVIMNIGAVVDVQIKNIFLKFF